MEKKKKSTKTVKTTKTSKKGKKTTKANKTTRAAKSIKTTKTTKKELTAKDRKKVTGGIKKVTATSCLETLNKMDILYPQILIGDPRWQHDVPGVLKKELATKGFTEQEIAKILPRMRELSVKSSN